MDAAPSSDLLSSLDHPQVAGRPEPDHFGVILGFSWRSQHTMYTFLQSLDRDADIDNLDLIVDRPKLR